MYNPFYTYHYKNKKSADGINKKKDDSFVKEYLNESISTEKLQKKLTFLFFKKWGLSILSFLMYENLPR